jgi:hypothetical protein
MDLDACTEIYEDFEAEQAREAVRETEEVENEVFVLNYSARCSRV